MIAPRLHRKLGCYMQLLLSGKEAQLIPRDLSPVLAAAVRAGSKEAVAVILAATPANCGWWLENLRDAGTAVAEADDLAMYNQLYSAAEGGHPDITQHVLHAAVKRGRLGMAVALLQQRKGLWISRRLGPSVDFAVRRGTASMVHALIRGIGGCWWGNYGWGHYLAGMLKVAVQCKRGKDVFQVLLAAAPSPFWQAQIKPLLYTAMGAGLVEATEMLLGAQGVYWNAESLQHLLQVALASNQASSFVPLLLGVQGVVWTAQGLQYLLQESLASKHASSIVPLLLGMQGVVWTGSLIRPLLVQAVKSEPGRAFVPQLMTLAAGADGEVCRELVIAARAAARGSWEELEQLLSAVGILGHWRVQDLGDVLDRMMVFGTAALREKQQQCQQHPSSSSSGGKIRKQQVQSLADPVPSSYWAALQCLLAMPNGPRDQTKLLVVLKVAAGLGGKGVLSQLLSGQEGLGVEWEVQQLQGAAVAAGECEEWEALAQLLLAKRVGWEVGELRDALGFMEKPVVAAVVGLLLQLTVEPPDEKVKQIAAALGAMYASLQLRQGASGYGNKRHRGAAAATAAGQREGQLLWHCISELLCACVGHWRPTQLQGLLYDAAAGGVLSVVEQLLSSWDGWEGELMQEALTAAAHRRDARMMQLLLEGAGPAGWTTQQLQKALVAAVTGGTALVQQLLGAPGIFEWDSGSLGEAVSAAAKHGCWGVLRCLVEVPGVVWVEDQLREVLGWAEEYGHAGMVQILQGLCRQAIA